MDEAYRELRRALREAETLASVAALLNWDQETGMPPRAGAFRAEELALVSRLAHERRVDDRIGELIDRCEQDPSLQDDERESANLREIRRDYERARRLPGELVAEMSETASRALEAWKEARAEDDFSRFRPWLDRTIELNRRKAACFDPPSGEAYDALLEDYEPGMTAARIERLFGSLREGLVELMGRLPDAAPPAPERDPDAIELPRERQQAFCIRIARALGYDFSAGRLDVSTHPFSSGLGPGDTRITTRFRDDRFTDALGSTLHEVGHALYEQGLPKEERHGEPLAMPLGLGVHESQSRTWENQVGRSEAFWTWALGVAHDVFGEAVAGLTVEDVVRAMNRVEPGAIRVEADELTYNLHVMLRFDLERAMLDGGLETAGLPEAWNERMRDDLDVRVETDDQGCLQDIHWAMGAIGYFPTYTLGNLYAAQFWQAIDPPADRLAAEIARGDFSGLLRWLRSRIHRHGRRYPAGELCRRVTGRELEVEPLLSHLASKLG